MDRVAGWYSGPAHSLATEYVGAVDKATVGGWSANPKKVTSGTLGRPFKPRSKAGYLAALHGSSATCRSGA
jgi:hypothetical protein